MNGGYQKLVVPRERRSPRPALPPGTPFSIVGIQFRRGHTLRFAKAAFNCDDSDLPFAVAGVREPDNPHDPNAIKVYGGWKERGWFNRLKTRLVHIGYVPREIAAELVEVYEPDADPGLALYSIYVKDSFVDVKVIALQPLPENG